MIDQPARRAYPKDVSDEEWWFMAPCLCLLREDCGQRVYPLRKVFNGLRYAVWAGCDGYKKKNGSKTHVAVDTLGHLLSANFIAGFSGAGSLKRLV